MTHRYSSDGAKTPAKRASDKPFTVEAGHRKVRRFVPRRAAGKAVFEEFQRVAARWSDPPACCDLRLRGDD